jgi:hypothetical protein
MCITIVNTHQAVHVSSWDKYKKEVLSGTLDWSPMHTSEVFWRNNVDKFEEKDFQLLRVLFKLLETNRDLRTQVRPRGGGQSCWARVEGGLHLAALLVLQH